MTTPAAYQLPLQRRAVRLAWATVAWNLAEAVAAVVAGVAAGSIALEGFGLDSGIEVFSALVIVWQFHNLGEQREQRAIRLIAMGFWALAAYLTSQAGWDLANHHAASHTPAGISVAVAALVVMPVLAIAKRRTGQQLGSSTVTADSKQSSLCADLSALVLAGLITNAALGWWWADPAAAIGIALVAANEGRQTWHGDACCD
jgi:divalent metal cation (Fe/Co/Zn/Cd) transporter